MDRDERISKARLLFNTVALPVFVERIAVSNFSPEVTIVKAKKPDYHVFGWASVVFTSDGQVEDQEGHLIDTVDLEKAAYSFNFTDSVSNDTHATAPFGRMIESVVFTPEKIEALGLPSDFKHGWWVGMELPPDRYDSVVSGERPMLSIEGSATLEELFT